MQEKLGREGSYSGLNVARLKARACAAASHLLPYLQREHAMPPPSHCLWHHVPIARRGGKTSSGTKDLVQTDNRQELIRRLLRNEDPGRTRCDV